MKRAIAALLALASVAPAAPPPDDVVRALTKAVRTHCPEATVEVTEDAFVAKHGTMQFTLHRRSKSGEVSAETYQQEGPNFKGFMLNVTLAEGPYGGAAVVPQTLQGPSFPTFIDAPPAGTKHYRVDFSYGSLLQAWPDDVGGAHVADGAALRSPFRPVPSIPMDLPSRNGCGVQVRVGPSGAPCEDTFHVRDIGAAGQGRFGPECVARELAGDARFQFPISGNIVR